MFVELIFESNSSAEMVSRKQKKVRDLSTVVSGFIKLWILQVIISLFRRDLSLSSNHLKRCGTLRPLFNV